MRRMAMMRGVLLVTAVLTGCGPIAYVNQVTREAASKVDRARELEAVKWSPYWWTRATTYLRMAREVAAHADFQGANRFGRLAAEAADKAIFEVENPAKRPHYETDDITPAKDKVAPAKDDDAPGRDDVAPAKE
jgi:hypothetical protein